MINEHVVKSMVKQAGGVYVGIQKALCPKDDLILFNDPITETTIAVKANIASVNVIRAELLRRRMIFNEPVIHGTVTSRITCDKTDVHLEVEAIRNQVYLLLAYIRPDSSAGLENLHQVLARLDVLAGYLKTK